MIFYIHNKQVCSLICFQINMKRGKAQRKLKGAVRRIFLFSDDTTSMLWKGTEHILMFGWLHEVSAELAVDDLEQTHAFVHKR